MDLKQLKGLLLKEENLQDYTKSIEINKKISLLEKKLNGFFNIERLFNNIKTDIDLCDSLKEEEQNEYETLINNQIKSLNKDIERLYLETLLNGEYDNNNAIVTIHSGAGGTESYDFVSMLYRMYDRYIQNENLKLNLLEVNKEDVGYKSLTFKVSGENAYGKLKSEKGIHRLVRISPFDSNKRRHTTFASIEVIPEIENDNVIIISDDDLKIDTFRSSGAGGQHINKTESAIRITHIPTGLVVTCQNERSQIQNKEQALRILKSKLISIKEQEHLDKISEISGNHLKIEWGSQIRSYVFCPYTMVKDHRSNYETANVSSVIDGEIEDFVIEYLKYLKKETTK